MTIRDGDWTLFDYDMQTGRSVWHFFDGERTHVRTDYPVENLIKDNLAVRNEIEQKGDYRKVASIPLNIFHEQLAPAIEQDDNKHLSRWLNDSDNRAFRTSEATV